MRSALCTLAIVVSTLSACDYPLADGALPPPPLPRSPSRDAYIGSIHVPSSLRPTLRWEPAPLPEGEEAGERPPLIYHLQLAADREFETALTELDISTTSYSPTETLAIDEVAPVGRRYYWRVKSCYAADSCSEYSATWWFNLGRSERDFTGDGYDDVLVGAPSDEEIAVGAGRAYLYLGNSILSPFPSLTLTGGAMEYSFGAAIAILGDVNGDGFADFAVSASNQFAPNANPGRVYVYFGGHNQTINAIADGELVNNNDINYLFKDGFGSEIAGIEDVNGDGFADLAVSSNRLPDGTFGGLAQIYYGGAGLSFDNDVDATLHEEEDGEAFAGSLDGAGDANGDGFADLLVGAYGSGGDSAGAAYLYFGSSNGLVPSVAGKMTGFYSNGLFGFRLLGRGDVNQDGFADAIVCARGTSDSSRSDAYVYLGGAGPTFDVVPDRQLAVPDYPAWATIESVQGDTHGRFIVGNADTLSGPGEVKIYSGESNGNLIESNFPISAGIRGDQFGRHVASAGDVNGDGFTDLIVGANSTDQGGVNAGAAYLFWGTASGWDSASFRLLGGPTAGGLFGVLPR